jgi:two-component system LytT family response regulator
MSITVLIVDDESLAREAIRFRLASETDMEIIGEAETAADAVDQIRSLDPDVVFLDVSMPEMSGFDVIAQAAPAAMPVVVFVTAYDRFAARAFETHAVDYLMKPFTAKRFGVALDRARTRLARAETWSSTVAALDEAAAAPRASLKDITKPYLTRIAIKRDHRIALIRVDDIDWIESAANYARVHIGSSTFLVRMTMNELEQRLDPAKFTRVHRTSIVQIDRVLGIIPAWHGDSTLKLRGGTELRLTRNYRARLLP